MYRISLRQRWIGVVIVPVRATVPVRNVWNVAYDARDRDVQMQNVGNVRSLLQNARTRLCANVKGYRCFGTAAATATAATNHSNTATSSINAKTPTTPTFNQGDAAPAHAPILRTAEDIRLLVETIPRSRYRNFSIVAHIDHGKSTLADRLLEMGGSISRLSKENAQVLDKLQVERERGITVKAQTASILYLNPNDNLVYLLNLIDTPGHVDFSYEVSRSLAACDGAVLLVDSSQGIQAQTLANYYQAMKAKLDIIPVLNKIDLPHSNVPEVSEQLLNTLSIDPSTIVACSAKTGLGVTAIFQKVIDNVRAPAGDASKEPRALLFDSWFDTHRGVICLVYVVDGEFTINDKIGIYHGEQMYDIFELGLMMPHQVETNSLRCGQVGYIIAGIKTTRDVRLGETIYRVGSKKTRNTNTNHMQIARSKITSLPGFQPAKSMVFAGLFPAASSEHSNLVAAVEKLTLNDPSVHIERESSDALGLGYRCGFLGVLHMQVFCDRLKNEFGQEVIVTAPTVPFHAMLEDADDLVRIESPVHFPQGPHVISYTEPWVRTLIIAPTNCLGDLLTLCEQYRGVLEEVTHITETRVQLRHRMPLSEIVYDFYDRLKSVTAGYASFDYEESGPEEADLVKIDALVNGEAVDVLSQICSREKSESIAKELVRKLKETIERQNFEIIIQAAIEKKIIARERIAPYRKDVTTKSGKSVGIGDQSRKKKLLDKQKEGKKRMKMVGEVELGEKVFTSIMGLGRGNK